MFPRTLLLVLVLVLCLSELTRGTELPAAGDDAAVLYEQAKKALPRAENRGERHVLLDAFATPMNGSVEALVRRAEPALALFDRASAANVCDWQIPASKPLAASQMAPVYGIDDFVILRARLRASRGDVGSALEDCRRLIMMGRRVEEVKSTVRQFQGGHLHNKAMITVGIVAPAVPKDQLRRFVSDLDRLPAPVAPAEVVAAEKQTFSMVHRRLIEDPKAREMLNGMTGLIDDTFGMKTAPFNVDDLVADKAKRDATFAEIGALFDEMVATLRLPPEQQAARWDALSRRARALHPLSQRAWKVGVMAQHVHQGQTIMRDLLRTAMRVIESLDAKDDAAAARLAAPYVFERRPGGFELRHIPPSEKTPYVLTIGPHDEHDWDAIEKRREEREGEFMLDHAP